MFSGFVWITGGVIFSPILGFFMVNKLAEMHKIEVLGESGIIKREGVVVKPEKYTRFEEIVSESGIWGWFFIFGFGIFVLPRIGQGIYYSFLQNQDVEMMKIKEHINVN